MPVTLLEITQAHLQEKNLVTLNAILAQLRDSCNRSEGYAGTIKLVADLDLQGHRILNLAAAVNDSDALSKQAGESNFGADKVRQQVEASGDSVLQTTRRLNDNTQRERSSTFLNRTTSTPPASNGSAITVASIGGGQSRIDVTASQVRMADNVTYLPFSARSDTVTNPGAGTEYYYYYVRESDATLQVDGPYTTNVSTNTMESNLDGRAFVGFAGVNAGGGGTGGGGDDTGGCVEVGTPLTLPAGSGNMLDVLPNEDWVEIVLEDGRELAMHPDTLVSVFMKASELQKGLRIEVEEGKWWKLRNLWNSKRTSHKMKLKVPGGTYLANGIRVHNMKPRTG